MCLAAAAAFGSVPQAREALLRACEKSATAVGLIEGTDVAAIAAAAREACAADQITLPTATDMLLDARSHCPTGAIGSFGASPSNASAGAGLGGGRRHRSPAQSDREVERVDALPSLRRVGVGGLLERGTEVHADRFQSRRGTRIAARVPKATCVSDSNMSARPSNAPRS